MYEGVFQHPARQVHSPDGFPEKEADLIPPMLKNVRLPGGQETTPVFVEAARRALISLIKTLPRKERALRDSLPLLLSAAPRWLDESTVALGPWRCNLSEATFAVTLRGRSRSHAYEGSFEQDDSGEWAAAIRKSTVY